MNDHAWLEWLVDTGDRLRTTDGRAVQVWELRHGQSYETVMEGVTDGLVVGKGVVEGVRCDHLAFRAPHIDWQIWIQEGDTPLPRKIVITTKDVAGAPQFAVVMTKWNLAPKFSDSLFAFKQPKDAKKVEFQPLEGGAPKAP